MDWYHFDSTEVAARLSVEASDEAAARRIKELETA